MIKGIKLVSLLGKPQNEMYKFLNKTVYYFNYEGVHEFHIKRFTKKCAFNVEGIKNLKNLYTKLKRRPSWVL